MGASKRPKLKKGERANGTVFYYYRRPSTASHAPRTAKATAKPRASMSESKSKRAKRKAI